MDVRYEELLIWGTMDFGTSRSIDLQHLHECAVGNGMKNETEGRLKKKQKQRRGLSAELEALRHCLGTAAHLRHQIPGASPRRPE